jgi:hypothetical protein
LAKDEFDVATEDERLAKKLKSPYAVALRTIVGKEFWRLETQEFRDEIAELANAQHAQNLKEWEVLQKTPKTALEFHQ